MEADSVPSWQLFLSLFSPGRSFQVFGEENGQMVQGKDIHKAA